MKKEYICEGKEYWLKDETRNNFIKATVLFVTENMVIFDNNMEVSFDEVIAPVPLPIILKDCFLYHATRLSNLNSIMENGLMPYNKQNNDKKGKGLSNQDKKNDEINNLLSQLESSKDDYLIAKRIGDILLGSKDDFIYFSNTIESSIDYLAWFNRTTDINTEPLVIMRWKNLESLEPIYRDKDGGDNDYKANMTIMPQHLSYCKIPQNTKLYEITNDQLTWTNQSYKDNQ